MPDIWDRAFSRSFYARWGGENAVISARTRHAVYPEFTQLLSIKMMTGGREDYFVDGSRTSVDDDTYLILNAGRRYGSRIEAIRPGRSFSIFFRRGLAREVLECSRRRLGSLLDEPTEAGTDAVEFGEQVREHDSSVTPLLRYIQREVDGGLNDEIWLEEQLQFLLARMLKLERANLLRHESTSSARPSVRRELSRRLGLAVNFIHANFHNAIRLADIARASHLSAFHLLRSFQAFHGMTPSAYLRRKRLRAAIRLIQGSGFSMTEIAEQVGFGNRATLYRQLRDSQPLGDTDEKPCAS